MANYADIEKIENLLVHGIDECGDAIVSLRDVRRAIAQAKNGDVQDVMHGKWEKCKEYCCEYRCSVCEYELCRTTNYCPNCGAKMDGNENSDVDKRKVRKK